MSDTADGPYPDLRSPEGFYASLSRDQQSAAQAILDWYMDQRAPQEFYLAGYAGTGKTTLAAKIVRHLGVFAAIGSYTGKAAAVLRKKGLSSAQTFHSMIYIKEPGTEPPRWVLAQECPAASARLIVGDEVSMVPDEMAADLRSFRRKILVLGDPEQLPPVNGVGAFTNREPDSFLREIHRQAAGSPVLRVATAIRERRPYGREADGDRARVGKLCRSEILAARGQLICGVHRARWGATRMVREKLGYIESVTPVVGERVICKRNNSTIGIYNGMLGVVEEVYEVDDFRWSARVKLDDLAEPVDVYADTTLFREHTEGRLPPPQHRRGIELFDFGYVITCHSAQGSEWEEVTVIDDSASFREEARRWLYTAVTRASERVTILRRV